MPDGDSPTLRPPATSQPQLVCPLCQQVVAANEQDDHLRIVHQLFSYRDVRRTLADTLDAIRDDLVTPRISEVAWPALVRLASDVHDQGADDFLAEFLATTLARLDPAQQTKLIADLAGLIDPGATFLLFALARSSVPAARCLALAGLARRPMPHDRPIRRVFRSLVCDRSLPLEDRLNAVAVVLPQLGDGQLARKLLREFVASHGKARSVDLLDQLIERTGPLPLLVRARGHRERRVRMTCPRCGMELRQKDMEVHLWDQHRLVLDGLRVRDPWQVVEEWLDSAGPKDEMIQRCLIAADKIDPQGGRNRLVRMLLVRGLADTSTRQAILAEARRHHAGCCPWCYAIVGIPRPEPSAVLLHRPGRLIGGGYCVLIDEQGLRPYLDVTTPYGVLYRDREPGGGWTQRGAAFLWAGTFVGLALFCAVFWPKVLGEPIRPVVFLLFLAWLAHKAVSMMGWGTEPARDRVLEHTWTWLAPRLHADGFNLADSVFLSGLAQLYLKEGRTDAPDQVLANFVRVTAQAVERGAAPATHLAALVRLQIEQMVEEDIDPVPIVAQWLARCFAGKLPLSFAQELLEDWSADWWTPINLARLRIITCDRAFEAGFEVQNLLDAGQNAPALGTVLNIDAPRRLAALRLIWSLRASRPWDKLGEVHTPFELAEDAKRSEPLVEHGDLLLWQRERRWYVAADGGRSKLSPAQIRLTLAGVWLQDVLFVIPPRVFEVRRKLMGYQLIVGRDSFRSSSDLEGLSRLLERWFRWVFHEVLPQVDQVLKWRSPERTTILRAWGAVPCPECGKFLLPRVGEVGIALDEAAKASG